LPVENLEIRVNLVGADEAAGRLNSLADALDRVEAAARRSNRVANDTARQTSRVGEAAKKANGGLKNFIASLKRIAFYRFVRSIIKSIVQAFQEGLEWAYQFSAGIEGEGNRFASAMDRIKTAGSTMKAQLGSAFIGLLTALEPIITKLCNLMTQLADSLSQIFAAFTGTTYLKAADVPQQWADAATSAGRAAKEWKNQLLGFDEINRLEEPSNGGGGSNSGVDPSLMFTDTPISEWAMGIRNAIEQSGLATAWGNLKEAFGNFGDSEFGTKLQEIFGIVTNSTFLFCLNTIASVLQIIADLLNGDLKKGVEDVWGFILDVVFDPLIMVARVIDTIFGTDLAGWLEDVKTSLEELDVTKFEGFQKLEKAFEDLKVAFDKLKESLQTLGAWLDETGVSDAIKEFLGWLLKESFDVFLRSLAYGIEILAGALTILADVLSGDFYSAINDIKNLLSEIVFEPFIILASVIDSIFGTDIAGWIEGVKKAVEDFDLAGWFDEQIEKSKQRWEAFKQFFVDAWENIKQFFYKLTHPFENVDWDQFAYDVGYAVGQMILAIAGFFTQTIPQLWDTIKGEWDTFYNETWPQWEDDTRKAIWDFITVTIPKFITEDLPELWNTIKDDVKQFVTEDLPQFILEEIPVLWNKIKEEVWNFFTVTLPEKIANIDEYFTDTGESIWDGIVEGWNRATEPIANLVNRFVQGFKDALGIHSPSTVFAEIGGNIVDGLWGGISSAWGGFESWFESVFQNLINWCQSAHTWLQDVITGIGMVKGSDTKFSGSIGTFASGGFPETGSLFFANEAGPELVGTIGGHTAVANNDQIVSGIRQGVYEAVMAANGSGNGDVTVKVYLDSKQIKAGQQRLSRAMGV